MKPQIKQLKLLFTLVCIIALLLPLVAGAKVSKSERDLILVAHLDMSDDTESEFWNKVYTFIESQGIRTAKKHLDAQYRKVHVIQTKTKDKNTKATRDDVIKLLSKVTGRKGTKAVDVIWMTHGHPKGKISLQKPSGGGNTKFSVGEQLAPKIKSAIGKTGQQKLRVLYSTACFGASAIEGWRSVGFKVVSGGRKVYTDSASSQPKFLKAWKKGKSFKNAVANANRAQKVDFWDKLLALSKRYKKDDLDSYRELKGKGCIAIDSNPGMKCKKNKKNKKNK